MCRPSRFPLAALPTYLAAACLLASVGCCSSFQREWDAAGCYCGHGDGLSGRWEGTWESHSNGHKGKLRAIITRCGEDQYYAHYRATWAMILPFEFELPMTASETDGVHHFTGQADLGCLAGGNYTYSGTAAGGCYQANYCARKDHGVFSMARLPDGGCCSR